MLQCNARMLFEPEEVWSAESNGTGPVCLCIRSALRLGALENSHCKNVVHPASFDVCKQLRVDACRRIERASCRLKGSLVRSRQTYVLFKTIGHVEFLFGNGNVRQACRQRYREGEPFHCESFLHI